MDRIVMTLVLVVSLAGCDSKEREASDAAETSLAQTSVRAEDEPDDVRDEAPAETHCTQAYADLEALVKGLEEQLGPSDAGMPDRADFVARCSSLPTEVQKCMVYEHAIAHKEDCERIVEELDPEQKKKAQELMGE